METEKTTAKNRMLLSEKAANKGAQKK